MLNLSGPLIKQEEWIKECKKVSIPVYEKLLCSDKQFNYEIGTDNLKTIVVFGDFISSDFNHDFDNKVKVLAENTGLDFFTIYFREFEDQYYFYSVTAYPDLLNEQTVSVLEKYFFNPLKS